MRKHPSNQLHGLQDRFDFIRRAASLQFEEPKIFGKNHVAEIYKSILKSLVVRDRFIVTTALGLARESFAGGNYLVYPMLHLPHDTNEQGHWHRDGADDARRVFWFPLTAYQYQGLSYIPLSVGFLSRPISFIGSRFKNFDLFGREVGMGDSTYYSWSPRLVHRGNLNTSDRISCALIIFLDKSVGVTLENLQNYDEKEISSLSNRVHGVFEFDGSGQIIKVRKERLDDLPQDFRSNFVDFFKLRTNVDLNGFT